MNNNSSNSNPGDIAPEHVARLLTQAAQQLDDHTVAKLRRAREIALDRQSARQPVFTLSTGHGFHMPHFSHQWVGMALLIVAMFFGAATYLHLEHENEISRLDTAILTDELPLEVFVD